MQSPSSMLNFPHSPSETTSAETKVATSGVATNFLYKLSGVVAYTSVAFTSITDAINTLTAGGTSETEPESSTRKSKSYNGGYLGDVMQINADDSDGAYDDDEMSDVEMEYNSEEINKKLDKKVDRKDDVKWSVNDDPPPPYDSSWVMPKNSDTNSGTTNSPVSSTTSHVENKPTSAPRDVRPSTISQTIPRRRQIRVRRPRRLLRRKSASTEVSTPKSGATCDDPDKLLLKVNDKLSDMIAQARAALTSTVDITEVDMLVAEEREREEKIMKELGLQTPIGRKGRKNTAPTDYEYFTSISDGNYSSPESSSYEFGGGFGAYGGEFTSPSSYDTPDAYPSHGHYNTHAPSQFPPSFNYSNLGYSLNNNHNQNYNNGKFAGENDFMNPMPNRFYAPQSGGYVDHNLPNHNLPKFGNGPVSGGFGGHTRLRFGQNNVLGSNYGHSFASPNGGFGSNGGYEPSGMYRGYV